MAGKRINPHEHELLHEIKRMVSDLDASLKILLARVGKATVTSGSGNTVFTKLDFIIAGDADQPHGLGGFVAAIHGRSNAMAVNVPVPALLDVEKILLSVMPRLANGHVDPSATITWASSDVAQVGIEPGVESFVFHDPQFNEDITVPGSYNCFALTPLSTGTGTVTASASGYESAEFGPINYAPGVARSLNASVGSPVSDL